ncbi:MAG: hypothetical protein IJY82_01965 [Oscillospiraceae bacterium]|nr:hypothetical protein [Oscillospiraceae bacterium]
MSYTNETALMELSTFVLPAAVNNGFTTEDLGDDFDGLQLSFQKIKIPSGGQLQFEDPSENPDDPKYEKYITGVIIYNHATNAYWPGGKEYDDNVPPMCSSMDGKTGCGLPGGSCAVCEMNQYGTDLSGGKGKACKNMRTLYILRSGEAMPIQLSLPPTSIRPFNEFVNSAFVTRKRPTWASVVKIGLKKMDNGSNVYSVATFQKVGDFSSEQLAQIREYATVFRSQINEMRAQRALEAENRSEADGITDTQPRYQISENGDGYEVVPTAPVINGDDDDLPL